MTTATATPEIQITSDDEQMDLNISRVIERREYRRHDLERQEISVDRWDGKRGGKPFGRLVDLSAGGMRVRTRDANVKVDQQIRVRLELPDYAGISPFVDTSGDSIKPKHEWVGWMAVSRIEKVREGEVEVAGRLVDMEDVDRGMLGLYLSTQPMAA